MMKTIGFQQFQEIVWGMLDGVIPDKPIAIIPDCNKGYDELVRFLRNLPSAVYVETTIPYPADQLPETYKKGDTKILYSNVYISPMKYERALTCSKNEEVGLIIVVEPNANPQYYSNDFEVIAFETEFNPFEFHRAISNCNDAIASILYTRKDKGYVVFDAPIKIVDYLKDEVYKVYAVGKPLEKHGFMIYIKKENGEVEWTQFFENGSPDVIHLYEEIVESFDCSMTREEADEKLSTMINGR